MEYNIIEFISDNKDEINSHINITLRPFRIVARIFDGTPDLQTSFMNDNKLYVLREYVAEHFNLSPEDLLTEIDHETLNLLGD